MTKVFVAVDVQNLWYRAKATFGKTYRVDFAKFKDLVAQNLPDDSDIEMVAYVVVTSDVDNRGFVHMLRANGYQVRLRKHEVYDSGQDFQNKSSGFVGVNWNVGITTDVMHRVCDNKMDILVLVSGDSEFAYLCEELKKMSRDIYLYTLPDSGASELLKIADKAFILDKRFVQKKDELVSVSREEPFSKKANITDDDNMEDVFIKLGCTVEEVARRTGYTVKFVQDLVDEELDMDDEIASRFSAEVGLSIDFWMEFAPEDGA